MANVQRTIKHGTIGGYQAHKRRGEAACDLCSSAWRIYYRRKRKALPRFISREDFERRQKDRRDKRKLRYDARRGGRDMVSGFDRKTGLPREENDA